MKILVTGHGKFSEGLKSSIDLIVGEGQVMLLNAYTEGTEFKKELEEVIEKEESICILTDLLGGSVNQEVMKYLGQEKVKVIAGVNLPLVLELVMINQSGQLTDEKIKEVVESSKQQIVFVNERVESHQCDDFE